MIEAVFFDLDGTLMDTSKDLGNALNAVLVLHGSPALPEKETRKEVSNGANALIKLGFGSELSEQQHQYYRNALLNYYLHHIAEFTYVFEGIESLIENLATAGIKWGIVTNKPQRYTDALMSHFTFAQPPSITICPDQLKKAKPDPEGLLLACTITGIRPENCLYIGDHQRDIDAGKNAGTQTLAVGYGFTETTSCHHQWGADHAVNTANEIWPIIKSKLG